MSVQSKPETSGGKGTAGDRGDRKEPGPEQLRAEIEQTRAEMGETVEALVAKVDIPSRVKQSAADKTAQLKESAADLKDTAAEKAASLKDAATGKAADLKDAATGKAADLKDAATGKAADLKDAASGKVAEIKDKAADLKGSGQEPGDGPGLKDTATAKATEIKEAAVARGVRARETMTHSPGHIAESTAQAGTRMAGQAADAADRATAVLGSARRRVAANPKQYAMLGAALATAAAGVALIRRSRR
ncbi:DUF3618 domain-containing protein [Actinoplanes sp. NPDC020271]|uniref:DUF3618 domain-containing protein n=1 Tax=Actinoplanes sp. NPDC020271 TaxID=3363896 RepID=UPI00378DDD99